jgi:hypothetical protein
VTDPPAKETPETKRDFQSGGFHPNAAGVQYIARGFAEAILRRSRADQRGSS